MTLDDTLAGLHPTQRAAVTHPARPLLLACGPGNGKTRILTHRIQWLIQNEGLEAAEILALTFSRAAADELRGRLARALGPLARGLWAGTFHGFGAWLLRRHTAPLERTAAFTILDREDTRRAIARLVDELGLEGDLPTWVEAVERAKAQPRPAAGDSPAPRSSPMTALLAAYETRCQAANGFDFVDLLTAPLALVHRDPARRTGLRCRFRAVLVDEAQDLCALQHALVEALAAPDGAVTFAGDDDQAIYGWRGGDVTRLHAFERTYPGGTVLAVGRNYRSTPQIVATAARLIGHNRARRPKPLAAVRPAGPVPQVLTWPDDREYRPPRVRALEGVETRHVAAPPAVDRLVIIARHRDRAVRRREGLDECVLEGAEVLRLVDQHGPEATPQSCAKRGVPVDERQRRGQLVHEVEPVRRPAPRLVGGHERRQRSETWRGGIARRRHRVGLRPFHGLGPRGEIALEAEFVDEAGDHPAGILTVQDGEGRGPAHRGGMPAEEPGAEPVEGARPQAPGQRAQRPRESAAQLVRGRPREREGQDLGRGEPLVLEEPLDPVREDPRLATPGATGEEQGPGRVRDRGALGRVQRRERLVQGPDSHTARWRRGARIGGHAAAGDSGAAVAGASPPASSSASGSTSKRRRARPVRPLRGSSAVAASTTLWRPAVSVARRSAAWLTAAASRPSRHAASKAASCCASPSSSTTLRVRNRRMVRRRRSRAPSRTGWPD